MEKEGICGTSEQAHLILIASLLAQKTLINNILQLKTK
jgi:hypothetical protein